MRIDKLIQGMEFKNYKVLCEFLEIKCTNGKAKKLQMLELERFVEYHKCGNAIIIDEVLKVPVEKIDKRKDSNKVSNNSKYSKDIQELIISMLAGADGNTVYLPTNRMLRLLDMVNNNYSEAKKHIPKLAEITNIPEAYCYDFFNTNNVQLKSKLETALRGLRNRALVIWKKSTTICQLVADIEINQLGEVVVTDEVKYHREHREATEEEEQLILRTEEEVLNKFNCVTLQYVFLTGRWNEFQKEVNRRLLRLANIEYYYDSYKIVYNKNSINKAHLKQLTYEERKKVTDNLNTNIFKMINNHANTLNKRAVSKEIKNTVELLQSTNEYKEHVSTLNDIVIKKGAKDITKELKKPLIQEQITFENMPF